MTWREEGWCEVHIRKRCSKATHLQNWTRLSTYLMTLALLLLWHWCPHHMMYIFFNVYYLSDFWWNLTPAEGFAFVISPNRLSSTGPPRDTQILKPQKSIAHTSWHISHQAKTWSRLLSKLSSCSCYSETRLACCILVPFDASIAHFRTFWVTLWSRPDQIEKHMGIPGELQFWIRFRIHVRQIHTHTVSHSLLWPCVLALAIRVRLPGHHKLFLSVNVYHSSGVFLFSSGMDAKWCVLHQVQLSSATMLLEPLISYLKTLEQAFRLSEVSVQSCGKSIPPSP